MNIHSESGKQRILSTAEPNFNAVSVTFSIILRAGMMLAVFQAMRKGLITSASMGGPSTSVSKVVHVLWPASSAVPESLRSVIGIVAFVCWVRLTPALFRVVSKPSHSPASRCGKGSRQTALPRTWNVATASAIPSTRLVPATVITRLLRPRRPTTKPTQKIGKTLK